MHNQPKRRDPTQVSTNKLMVFIYLFEGLFRLSLAPKLEKPFSVYALCRNRIFWRREREKCEGDTNRVKN